MKTLTYIDPKKRDIRGGGLYLNYRLPDEELVATGIDSAHSELFIEIADAYNSRQAAKEAMKMLSDC